MYANSSGQLGRGCGVNIQQKVRDCSVKLEQWGKEITGQFSNRIKVTRWSGRN